MRITTAQRTANENRIRAAIDRLLRGDIPNGGRCDIKTLARAAGVDRTAFYGDRPYAHLRAEFEQRLHDLQQTGERPDPRDAQITRIKDEITTLKRRLTQSADTINGSYSPGACRRVRVIMERCCGTIDSCPSRLKPSFAS